MLIKATPWDKAVFGVPTWELLEYSTVALQQAVTTRGHHTIRVDPLADKRLLYEWGFYYCDSLIEPFCNVRRLCVLNNHEATISKDFDKDHALEICNGAFSHGRFHRDFNLNKEAADQRYNNWLEQLIEVKQVYGLYWQDKLAGFIGYSGKTLVLHCLAEKYRGKGLSKYWWSAVCNEIIALGNNEVRSSISTTNIAVLNLYTSLGFSFNNPKDVYHHFVP